MEIDIIKDASKWDFDAETKTYSFDYIESGVGYRFTITPSCIPGTIRVHPELIWITKVDDRILYTSASFDDGINACADYIKQHIKDVKNINQWNTSLLNPNIYIWDINDKDQMRIYQTVENVSYSVHVSMDFVTYDLFLNGRRVSSSQRLMTILENAESIVALYKKSKK